MTRLNRSELLAHLIAAAAISGWTVTFDARPSRHPYCLHLRRDDDTIGVRVYIWNISHGGKRRPEDEYRVQITGVDAIERTPGFKTLILGFWGEGGVFAGWDASMHAGALIGIDPDYTIVVNEVEMERLRASDLGAGKAYFVRQLRPVIHLPPERDQRPRSDYLRQALIVRGWLS